MKNRFWMLLPLLCLLTACGREIAEPVNAETIETQVVETTGQRPGEQRTGEPKSLDFRTLYRGFSPVSLDGDREAFASFGVKVITNEDDWGTFMGSFCPGIPYEESIDFEKEYLVASMMQGSRPGYIGAEHLNGLVWKDGYFLLEYDNDSSDCIYALNGDSVTHFYVEVIIVSREDVPWVAEEQLYHPEAVSSSSEVQSAPVTFDGYALTPDGDSAPVRLTMEVENVLKGEDAFQRMLSQGAQVSTPEAGKEYILVTLKVTYEDGDLETLNFMENYPASWEAARVHFNVPNENSNTEDVTHGLANSIWGPDPFSAQPLGKGESISGDVAFLQDAGNTQPLYFEGYGQVVKFQVQ